MGNRIDMRGIKATYDGHDVYPVVLLNFRSAWEHGRSPDINYLTFLDMLCFDENGMLVIISDVPGSFKFEIPDFDERRELNG